MAKAVWEVIRMTKMTKEAERVKNSERAPYRESELKELSKEELQGLYLGFYEKESWRLREPGLIKAILKAESEITDKETVRMVKTNEVTTAKTTTLSELQDRVEVLKGRYELYCLRVKTSKYHLQDVMRKENRTCYEVMQARDEYKSARYERFRTYVEYRKMLSELRAATEIRKETITMTEKAKLTVKELDEAIKSASNRDEAEALLKEATVKTLRGLMRCLNGFDGEWYRARKAELIEALLDYYGSVWEKETETTEQIIAEIESAETLSEIRAVLNDCTKAELHEVYESITGNSGESNSWKKDDLVSWYSKKILAHKACETQESEKQNEGTAEDHEGTLTVRPTLIGSAIEEARAECEALQKDPEILGTSFIVGKRYRYGGNEYELIERDWHTLKFRMNGEKVIRRQLKGACESPTGSCVEFINGLPEAGMYTYADEAINNAEIVAENIAKAGVGKTEKAIEELTEGYVSDEEKKLSEICQKANEIESCATVEEITEETAQQKLAEIESERDKKKRESVIRSLEASEIEELAREKYGSEYVREMLIKLMCGSETEVELKEESANVFEFKRAFDELERGRVFVNIPELREKLNWSHEVFDEMLRKLRDDGVIYLVKTEIGNFDVKDFFYDEDNQRRGMVTWNKSLSA